MKPVLIKYLKRLGYLLFLVLICLCGLEVCFRYQLIDFYQSELKGLNTEEQLTAKKDNILVFGDSFTAHPESYVSYLRKKISNYNFINSAIPGAGIKQHELLFKKRITAFKPKAIIYQFYVGNDFTDIKHPINFKELSFIRNIFWKMSEHFLVLQYINHRLAFLNTNNQPIEKLQEAQFSKELYNNRVKTYYKADNLMLNNTILLNNNAAAIYDKWEKKLSKLEELSGNSVPIYLLIIPHNAQINNTYLERNKILGAELSPVVLNPDYPLLQRIKEDFISWEIISPLTQFQQLQNSDSLYYQNDPHLTAYGQEELGRVVENNLNLTFEH